MDMPAALPGCCETLTESCVHPAITAPVIRMADAMSIKILFFFIGVCS
jgi:hypothetical protein